MTALERSVCYADQAWHGTVDVLENVRLARDTYRLRLACPQIARRIVPGQFVMLRLSGCDDPLLGRPLALYDVIDDAAGRPAAIDVVYLVVGKLTSRLANCSQGQRIELWGPLGNGFPPQFSEHLVMVAGGIGQTPFVALAKECLGLRQYGDAPPAVPRSEYPLPWRERVAAQSSDLGAGSSPIGAVRVSLCYGARSADLLAGVEDFERLGVDVHISTDDGTAGHHGLVTDLLKRLLDESSRGVRVVCCGPEKMMEAVARLTHSRQVSCQVSLETPMACGIGICFSCVARVCDASGGWDYRRTCVEGPVFDAEQIVF